MRIQTNKSNMRDARRRGDKRTHGVLREERRRKRSNKKRRRRGLRELGGDKSAADSKNSRDFGEELAKREESQLEKELKEENVKLKEERQCLVARLELMDWSLALAKGNDQKEKELLRKVHTAQARLICRLERTVHLLTKPLGVTEARVRTLEDVWELAGVAC